MSRDCGKGRRGCPGLMQCRFEWKSPQKAGTEGTAGHDGTAPWRWSHRSPTSIWVAVVRMPWLPGAMARLVATALSVVLPWDILVNEGY